MNKISKKIVALVTMAAFVLTLVPVAAFAAKAEPTKSYILTTEKNVVVDTDVQVPVQLDLRDSSGTAASNEDATVYVWAEAVDSEGNASGEPTRAISFYDGNGDAYAAGNTIENVVLNQGYALKMPGMTGNTAKFKVAFSNAGEYIIKAAIDVSGSLTNPSINDLVPMQNVDGQDIITVNGEDVAVTSVTFGNIVSNSDSGVQYATFTNNGEANENNKTLTANMANTFVANGIATAKVTATVSSVQGVVGAGEEFTLKTQNGLNLSTDKVTTDRNGQISFTFTMDAAKNYKVYMENEDLKITLNINRAEASEAENIETTVNNAQVLEAKNKGVVMADAVQFTITDKNGTELADSITEPAQRPDTDYVKVISKPEKSTLSASDVKLAWDSTNKVWTIGFANTVDASKDLVAGEYTVEIALESGDKAQATFTLAEFGDITGINVKMVGAEAGSLDKTVVAGETVYGDVYVVDENGIEKPAATEITGNYSVSMTGRAIDTAEFKAGNVSDGSVNHDFKISVDNSTDVVGTVIKVKAFDSENGKLVQKELTVVDGLSEYSLAFDSENGPANKENTVNVTVVDEDGNVVDVDGAKIYAYVDGKSVEDANVEANTNTDNTVNNGKGVIKLYSDVETKADIVVAVVDPKGANNNAIYAGTLSYTFGKENVNAEKSVVMTIGSSDLVVDNNIVTGDAAPYVADNRTMVPIRALTESFGAKVDYDNDAKTVTIVDGDTTIVMTIGETTYTVNGEEKTMDVAPVIGSGDRTYVPVRFVGEALGYEVTALYAADGTTSSVVFQK